MNAPTTTQDEADQILIAAAALIRKGWCQGNDAVDANGSKIRPEDPNAVRWCAMGAIFRAAFDLKTRELVNGAVNRINAARRDIVAYNDHADQNAEQVARVLELAAGVKHDPQ